MKRVFTSFLSALFLSLSNGVAYAPEESSEDSNENIDDVSYNDKENTTDEESDDNLYIHLTPQEALDIAIKIHEHNEGYDSHDYVTDASQLCLMVQLIHGYEESFAKSAYICHASFLLRQDSIGDIDPIFESAAEYASLLDSEGLLCRAETISNAETLIFKLVHTINSFYSIEGDAIYALNIYPELEMRSDENVVELMSALYEFHSNYGRQIETLRRYGERFDRLLNRCDPDFWWFPHP